MAGADQLRAIDEWRVRVWRVRVEGASGTKEGPYAEARTRGRRRPPRRQTRYAAVYRRASQWQRIRFASDAVNSQRRARLIIGVPSRGADYCSIWYSGGLTRNQGGLPDKSEEWYVLCGLDLVGAIKRSHLNQRCLKSKPSDPAYVLSCECSVSSVYLTPYSATIKQTRVTTCTVLQSRMVVLDRH